MEVGRTKPGPYSTEDSQENVKQPEAELSSLPDDVLSQIFANLPQNNRASMSLCCKRWANISRTSKVQWRTVHLEVWLNRVSNIETSESFISWVLQRAPFIKTLTIAGRVDINATGTDTQHIIWGNIIAALTHLGPTLDELTLDWYTHLHLSGWMGALVNLQTANFTGRSVTVRPGLGSLTNLVNLRFRSLDAPLCIDVARDATTNEPSSSTVKLLPPNLQALRMDACNLSILPSAISCLAHLTDLVLSNNNFNSSSLDVLAHHTALKQLTLMGTRMDSFPPVIGQLQNLQVLYLDGVIGQVQEHTHLQCDVAIGPLKKLGILSLGSSRLKEFPSSLLSMTSLRALYLDNNPFMSHLPNGRYLQNLRVIGIDWSLLLKSYTVLTAESAPQLEKLCLTCIGGVDTGIYGEDDAAAVVAALCGHPNLRLILLPMVECSSIQLSRIVMDLALQLASNPKIVVRAVSYGGISNEWIEWLDEITEQEKLYKRMAAATLAGC